MGWLTNLFLGEDARETIRKQCGALPPVPSTGEMVAELAARRATKTGEQLGKMTDPHGKRLYHEYFVGDDRGDGHFPWSGRVYSNGEIAAEKTGLAASYEVARKQAIDWAIVTRKAIGVMWKEQP